MSASVTLVLPAPEGVLRGKRSAKDFGDQRRSPRVPGELDWASLPGGEEGKGWDGCRAVRRWCEEARSSAGPRGALRLPAVCGQDLGSSFFVPASAVVPFPSSVVVSKARCE